MKALPQLTYPIWLLAHILQSEKLRGLFLRLSKLENRVFQKQGFIEVVEVQASSITPETFRSLIYNKSPVLIRGLAKEHQENPKITHEYLINNFGDFKTSPRIGDNQLSQEKTIRDILTENNPTVRQTIASSPLTQEARLKTDIGISKWIPHQGILDSPLLNNTLFVSSEGFYTRLHMEAGRLLNVQLSGKKTWYLINPRYSHIVEPLISDTTIHFSDVVKEISDIEEKLASKVPVYTCTLEQGDVLLIPPFYWHTVFCEEKAVSTTYQWLTLFKPFFENPFMSLFLLTSRNPSLWDVLMKRGQK